MDLDIFAKSFLIDPLTTSNAIYRDWLILRNRTFLFLLMEIKQVAFHGTLMRFKWPR